MNVDYIQNKYLLMKKLRSPAVILWASLSFLVAGCGGSGDTKQPIPKVTTRWKYVPKSIAGIPQGIIIEQEGDKVESTYCDLKDGDGFVVARTVSHGKYFPDKHQIVLPPGPLAPNEIDMAIKMDVPRVVVQFDPKADTLKAKWSGQGSPTIEMEFSRVK